MTSEYDPRIVPARFDCWRANLNFVASSCRQLDAVGQLESYGALLRVVERVDDVDRQPALVEHVRSLDVLDLQHRDLERRRREDEAALLREDLVHSGHFVVKTITTAGTFRFGKRIVYLANALTN